MAKYISQFTGSEIDNKLAKVAEASYFDSTAMSIFNFSNPEDMEKYQNTRDESLILSKIFIDLVSTQIKFLTENTNLYFTTRDDKIELTTQFITQQKRITDSAWENIEEDYIVNIYIDKGATGNYQNIVQDQYLLSGTPSIVNVKSYLSTGQNRVKVSVKGQHSDIEKSLIYTVNLTTMYIAPVNFTWNVPFIENQTYLIGGLYIGGNLDKILKIKVSNEQTYSKLYEINLGTQTNTSIAYYYDGLNFPTEGTGIYTVEMWLDANGLESEHLHYNIMCIAEKDVRTAQLIAVSDVPSTVKNYDTNKIFSYAVYNGGATVANPIINVSAIINNTPTVITKDEELSNVPTGEINDYIVDLEVDSQETNIQLYSSIELGGCKQEAVYAVDNSASYPAVAGAEFYLNPANRNNTQGNKETIINESNLSSVPTEYTATWSGVSYVDGMDGWTVDNYGRKCLRLPAKSKVEIDYAPFANASTRTIEISYRVENASNYEEDIISIASELTSQFVGARIKPTNVLLHSGGLKTDDLMQSYNTKDEELVHLLITVIRNYKQIGNLAQIYVNGVKKCSFEWSAGDTFAHNGTIKFGSDTADLYIYKARVYKEAFDWVMAVQNFISCLPDTASKKAAYSKLHSVLNDGNNIDFDKVKNAGLNYFTLRLPDGAQLPSIISPTSVPHSRLVVNIQQKPDFIINGLYEDETTEGQGTTAMNYWDWNLRWKTSKVRITAKRNWASPMHSHKMGGTALFNDLHQMIVGANEANGRVAVEQYAAYGFLEVLKEGTTNQFDYIPIGLYTIGQDKGDKPTFGYNHPDYKDTLIHMEGTDHSPKAVGMDYPWNKLNVATNTDGDANLGVQKADGSVIAAWEIGACGKAKTDAAMFEYLTQEFKPAYDCDYLNTSMIIGLDKGITINDVNENLSAFRALETDNGYTAADCLIWIDGEYETYYYDVLQEKYVKDGVNILTDLGITASDLSGTTAEEKNREIRMRRMMRYRDTMENYWHLRDNLFHYCFIVLFAATDNFKKNTYPYKFGTLASGSRWRWRQDDLDTLFDINNQGLANKIYSILNGDKSGTTHLFRGNTSYHWTNIQFYYENEIKGMIREILTAMASLSDTGSSLIEKAVGCIRKYFWNKAQDYFTKSAYNIDAEAYEEAWAAMKNGTYKAPVHPLQQSLGSHYEAERAFVELRFLFMASLYGFGAFAVGNDSDTSLGQISFRPAQGDNTFHLTPAINMNPTILIGDSDSKSAEQRLNAGETVDITVSTDGDTSIYIQGTDYLSDIGDFSKINLYAENPALNVSGKRLQKLKVGDENPSEVTTLLKTLNVLSCPSMSEIDARNVTTLTGTIDLSQCPRLTKALFGGSSAGEIVLPKGSKIIEFELPDTLTNLSLVNLPNLDNEGLKYGELNALTFLRLENNKNIEGFAMLKATYEAGSPLTNIRVIGFDYDGTADDVSFLATLAQRDKDGNPLKYFGIDADGSRNNNIIPVIEGTLNIDGSIYKEDEETIIKNYGVNLKLNVTGGYYVKFADPEVQRIVAENWGDGTGITLEQAESVTEIKGQFRDNLDITNFNEFEKFIGVKSIRGDVSHGDKRGFGGCENLKSIILPIGLSIENGSYTSNTWGAFAFTGLEFVGNLDKVVKIGNYAFRSCINLSYSGEYKNEDVLSIGTNSFENCGNFNAIINVPNLTSIGSRAFDSSGITKIENLGKITSIPDGSYASDGQHGVFALCNNLTEVNFPSTLVSIGAYAFFKSGNLRQINNYNNVTNIGQNAFYDCTTLEIEDLSLPNLETLGQNAFYGVKIKKISNLGKVTGLTGVASNNGTFGDKNVLEEIILPNTLQTVGYDCFRDYKNTSIVLSESITTIYENGFANSGVEFVKLPNLISGAYFSRSKVKKVVDLGSIKTLPGYAFQLCGYLDFAIIPDSVTSIGNYAFSDNGNKNIVLIFKSVVPPALGATIFSSSPNTKVYVPDASVTAYQEATGWIDYASRIKSISNLPIDTPEVHEEIKEYFGGGIMVFKDSNIKDICVSRYDADKNGYLTLNEVQEVTAITGHFVDKWNIYQFEEFKYFTGIKNLVFSSSSNYGCFTNTSLTILALPPTIESIQEKCITNSKSLVSLICTGEIPAVLNGDPFSDTYVSADLSIYVPDQSVDAYKTSWSIYADRIKKMSDYVE